MHLKNQIKIGLGYFLLAATLGLVVRYFLVFDLAIDYKYIVHTHSHIAPLGWVYVLLTTLIFIGFRVLAQLHLFGSIFLLVFKNF